MTEDLATPKRKSRAAWALAVLNHNWTIAVLGGLLVIFLTPLVTGFANLTFSTRSWEVFGAANAVDTPGSRLVADSVYRLPLNEKFRVDGDLLLSVYWKYDKPNASLTATDGRVVRNDLGASSSLHTESGCDRVAVHLMRAPEKGDPHFYVMYTTQPLKAEGCGGWTGWLFG